MARNRNRRAQRDVSSVATPALDSLVLRPLRLPAPVSLVDDISQLTDVSDGRRFDPTMFTERALSFSGADAPVRVATTARRKGFLSPALSFAEPQNAVVCVRRQVRREVLFALKRTRKGAGKSRRRRSRWSDVRC